jgi:hypothetical protein
MRGGFTKSDPAPSAREDLEVKPVFAGASLSAYYENRYVDDLKKSGFFKRLWQ